MSEYLVLLLQSTYLPHNTSLIYVFVFDCQQHILALDICAVANVILFDIIRSGLPLIGCNKTDYNFLLIF